MNIFCLALIQTRCLLALAILSGSFAAHASVVELRTIVREGDIIFSKSLSKQSPALQEMTGSEWTHTGLILKLSDQIKVLEAAGNGVAYTTLEGFLSRSLHGQYAVKRPKATVASMDADQVAALKAALLPFIGLRYDKYFEWSDSRIYCSELVYKGYLNGLNLKFGREQVIGDFALDGPLAQRLIRERYTEEGRELNLNEPVVSPVAVLESPDLESIASQVE